MFLSVLPKLPYEQCYIYLEYMFVISTQFIICVQMTVNWPVTVTLSLSIWKFKKKSDLELTFPIFLYGDYYVNSLSC
jgi:hypothetical protein